MGVANTAELFAKAIGLEETEPAKAATLYAALLLEEPCHAGACINLGTICFNKGEMEKAELFYRRAIAADSRYALAYFNLGNVLDEFRRYKEAEIVYLKALELAPDYADAHYNLAVLYQRLHSKKALQHWQAYIKLDPSSGVWRDYAAQQIKTTAKDIKLEIVVRNPGVRRRQKDELRNPGMFLVKKQ